MPTRSLLNPRCRTDLTIQTYRIQDWVFKDALGNYNIDLGDSNAPCLTLDHFGSLPPVALDYGTDRGSQRLREQVAGLYGLPVPHIGIAHGAQEALYLLYRTLLKPGEHVITCGPGWQQSWEAPRVASCRVSIVPYGAGFSFDLQAIEAAIQHDTRAIVINAPCNPTGRTLDADGRVALIRMVEKHRLYLIADEEYLLDPRRSLLHLSSRVVSVASLSKIYGAPGLRVGWLAGEPAIVRDAMAYKQPHYHLELPPLRNSGDVNS